MIKDLEVTNEEIIYDENEFIFDGDDYFIGED